jgi:hypothetical protein
MGRPRKTNEDLIKEQNEQIQANKNQQDLIVAAKSEKVELDKVIEPIKEIVMKDTAYSVVRNPINQRWVMVSIDYDFATKTVGKITIVEEHTDRYEIISRYQIKSGDTFMS